MRIALNFGSAASASMTAVNLGSSPATVAGFFLLFDVGILRYRNEVSIGHPRKGEIVNEPSRHEIIANDGQSIVSQFFAPEREARGVVLIVPAMGTAQRYYAA